MRVANAVSGGKSYNFKFPNDIPLFGGFFRMPYRNPKILTDYYKLADKQTELHSEKELTGKTPDGYDESLFRKIKASEKAMKKLAKLERSALANLHGSQLEDKQAEIQKKRIEIAERILQTL